MPSSLKKLRVVCISDTHNDDPTGHVPDGDVLLHAGDMTDDGTYEELERALTWIRRLPHKLKIVIPGNHDLGLDPNHKSYDPNIEALFLSQEVRNDGVVYIKDRHPRSFDNLFSIYANPTQPDFLASNYAFTYLPHPNQQAIDAWSSAPPTRSALPIDIWLSHGAPRGRLDQIPIPGLMGCEAQREKVAVARPLLCVFGHYHVSYNVEKVTWGDKTTSGPEGDGIVHSKIITDELVDGVYDLSTIVPGQETIFINAAWMTGEKRQTEKRNKPIVLDLRI